MFTNNGTEATWSVKMGREDLRKLDERLKCVIQDDFQLEESDFLFFI